MVELKDRDDHRKAMADAVVQQKSLPTGASVQLKKDLIERLGLKTIVQMIHDTDEARIREELAVACQAALNTGAYALTPQQREVLINQVLDEICGLGPIQPLLDDATISEVMINGCDSLFYERHGEIYASQHVFESAEQIMVVIDRILSPLGRRLDESSPIVNARLANGDRVNAVAAPIAVAGPIVTIRKFSQRIASLQELIDVGALPQWYATLLSWAVKARKDIAVAGGTGSGKTTLLNALSCEISHKERIVTIEDSAELKFDSHPHVVRLETRDISLEGTGEITIRDLVKNALRMRPDRIVVGEVRGEECIDMLQAMNTGHDGSLTTLHAGTADEAVLRLILMARFGMDLPAEIIEEQIATALDFIVMTTRGQDGARRVGAMSAVVRNPKGGVELKPCVEYDARTNRWHLAREPAFISEAIAGEMLTAEEVQTWRQLAS